MGHGNQWEAIYPDFKSVIQHILPLAVAKGHLAGEAPFVGEYDDGQPHGNVVAAICYQDGLMGCLVLLDSNTVKNPRTNSLATAFPYLPGGIAHRLEIDKLTIVDMPMEGIVHVSKDGFEFDFFDPSFYRNRFKYKVGETHEFSVAALAYSLHKAETAGYDIDKGPLVELERQQLLKENPHADVSAVKSVWISLENAAICFPHPQYPGECEFRGPVKTVEWFKFDNLDFCRLLVTLVRPNDQDFDVFVYAAAHVLGDYRPKSGDDVEGVVWLQGNLVE
jgi:hypothetical protein